MLYNDDYFLTTRRDFFTLFMQHSSPVILTLNLFDPSNRAWLPAETTDMIRFECQPLSVVTAITIQDSVRIEEILSINSDWINDQARCLLEDMTPNMIKVGALTNPESCAIAAQILSDYDQIPSVLLINPAFFIQAEDEIQEEENEVTLSALLHLVAPLASYVVIDATHIEQWLPEHQTLDDLLEQLFDQSVQYCAVVGQDTKKGPENLLYTNQGGQIYLQAFTPHKNTHEQSELFSTAFTCLISHDVAPIDAAQQAVAYANEQLNKQIQIGMGSGLPRRSISPPVREQ